MNVDVKVHIGRTRIADVNAVLNEQVDELHDIADRIPTAVWC
jgi:hypothetical protein